jgi:hypothetical protein
MCFPLKQKTVIVGRPLPAGARSVRYDLHEMVVGDHFDALYGDRAEADAIRARLSRAVQAFRRSVPGRGRAYSVRKLEGTMRLTRVA